MKTLSAIRKSVRSGEKVACLTAYDASFAHWVSTAGVDVILVGDSLGMVVQGHKTTLPVSLDEMVYHTQMVQRGNQSSWCIADLPFMSDASVETCLSAASRLMKEGQANMVKLEGGERVLPMVKAMSDLGIPVCGHLGLLPQSVEKHGYKVAGRDESSAEKLMSQAQGLEQAGADMLVLECVPADLAKEITSRLNIPVIGIGSGPACDGQVLVLQDILGITVGKTPLFAHNFLAATNSIESAIRSYVKAVKEESFPAQEHCF
ncbi:3-methyl-2-oxobutanoate hydroxymethyltransferase [Thiomicrorhabdus indica]|uniref:3-methyl-2-oxobutanoate hydroxymethyltransferase n=1 Tax=Thiomicrorhabdus indica TaxID=2267253 RepID=UPI00102D9F52|nr:3-methyl-2-oxobutanoate hydroxymethyltransferase [Thiomicrorhabdus indica]